MAIPKAIEHMRSGSGGLETVEVTSADGITYTGTSKSIKEYKVGMVLSIIPNRASANTTISNIIFNINGLGNIKLAESRTLKIGQQNGLSSYITGYSASAGFLKANEAFIGQLEKNGDVWYIIPQMQGFQLSDIAGGTLGSNLTTSSSTVLNGRYLRNVTISTSPPSASDGLIGDIWIQYSGT